jgi:hypothetical protein
LKRTQKDVGKPDKPAKKVEWDISDSDLKESEKCMDDSVFQAILF